MARDEDAARRAPGETRGGEHLGDTCRLEALRFHGIDASKGVAPVGRARQDEAGRREILTREAGSRCRAGDF